MTLFCSLPGDIQRKIHVQAEKLAKKEALEVALKKRPLPKFDDANLCETVKLIIAPDKHILIHNRYTFELDQMPWIAVVDLSHINIDLSVCPKRVLAYWCCSSDHFHYQDDQYVSHKHQWHEFLAD